MAEVISAAHRMHAAGHEGIGLECPVSCMGVRTVGDLLRLLVTAGRMSGLHAAFAATVAEVPHEHDRVMAACPVECLGLSAHVLNALRNDRGRTATVGDVLALLRSHELAEVRNIGSRRVGEVRTALVAAGFPVPHYGP
ncbi:DNA-directed RNA polymerase subunit alpha C-terminal domain-containing protein [Actinomadura sp. 3N407]|uniref:DNA-directed RNA polymerase subunit alpha C-terminal domain-containing protein n=1 Tax=Actinomadura sp. 3N407 TaxID=3457423 RepID=UPI003FCE0684